LTFLDVVDLQSSSANKHAMIGSRIRDIVNN
jgi:hypothetical protein